jgi:hypothetical protein
MWLLSPLASISEVESCEVGKRESDVAVTPWVIVIVGMTVKNDIAIPQPISLGIPFINLL